MISNEKKQTENISCPEYLNINKWFNAERGQQNTVHTWGAQCSVVLK